MGFRFRLHDRTLPGKPDLILRRHGAVILVHGCFWHGHDCPLFRWPATRASFWRDKIGGNRKRDASNAAALHSQGWRVLEIWECALRGGTRLGVEKVLDLAADWIRSTAPRGEIRGLGANG